MKQTTKDTSSRLVTHLDIRLGGAGQGAADRRPVAGEKRLAVVSGGPAELLGWLETRLGLVPDDQPRAARVLSYARALDRARPPEVAASFEQDRWGTASELLRRREELRLAGWEGTAQATYPPVVQALAAVERQLDESITDTAARLNAVLAALDMGQRLPAHRLVSDHIEAWPLCWQRVLQHLDAAPPGPTKPAAPKGPLRVVQRQLLSGELKPAKPGKELQWVSARSVAAACDAVVLGDNYFSRLTTTRIPHRTERQHGPPSFAIIGSPEGGDSVIKDAQVRKLMEELARHGKKELAALRAGMDSKTARKYREQGEMPSQAKVPHTWRTREDPFAEDWEDIKAKLKEAPELEAKALFEHLLETTEGRYQPGQLRTLQRKLKQWRAQEGPPKEVFFAQEHRPGEAMQTDFTWANELKITIGGEPFEHMLCHAVLPYSNWEWATVCHSESTEALRRGVQAAVFQLGRVPTFHQTDQSSGATHSLPSRKREFNDSYVALMNHLGMKPRTIGVGKKEQNGDVEALNGALKRRMEQHLLLRGNRDFDSVADYERWLQNVLNRANSLRGERFEKDFEAMTPLSAKRLPEYTRFDLTVSSWSVITVKGNVYSVPSRLRGEKVRVLLYEDRLEVLHGGIRQLTIERLRGQGGHRINYRHIIWSLVRKPGAFERYKYRDDLFPTLTFRQTYDALTDGMASTRKADIEYLRILHLAASTMESEVEVALELLRDEGTVPTSDRVKALVVMAEPELPAMAAPTVDLGEYDALLQRDEEVAS